MVLVAKVVRPSVENVCETSHKKAQTTRLQSDPAQRGEREREGTELSSNFLRGLISCSRLVQGPVINIVYVVGPPTQSTSPASLLLWPPHFLMLSRLPSASIFSSVNPSVQDPARSPLERARRAICSQFPERGPTHYPGHLCGICLMPSVVS